MSKRETGYINRYQHLDCPQQPGIKWSDQWSCACNDRCPACRAEIEPYLSEEDGTQPLEFYLQPETHPINKEKTTTCSSESTFPPSKRT